MLWRDEHSAPFSWKTPSQIDLTIFTSSNGDIHSSDGLLVIKSKGKLNQHLTDSLQSDENFDLKFENSSNGIKNQDKSHDAKKSSLSPESSNVVLVGTCSKLSGLCSKFKFLPGKSYSYEVQTVVTNPSGSNDGSLLDKIKATAVLKFQSTLKLMGGKTADKKLTENKDTENLVQCKSGPTVIRMNKASPKIAKPKSPPPPPPVLNLSLNSGDKDEMKAGKNLIFIKSDNPKSNVNEMDSEKITLLEENSMKSFSYADLDASDLQSKVVHEISDDFNSLSTECTPLSGPSTDVIPKSGFDFLDNW